MKYLEGYLADRKKAAKYYTSKLSTIDWLDVPFYTEEARHSFNQYTITLAEGIDRDHLMGYLKEKGIPTMVYYGSIIQDQPAYQKYKRTELAISSKLAKKVLSLPMHTELSETQQDFICNTLAAYTR